MKQKSFFQLQKVEDSMYDVLLNKEHPLFETHFPDFPILPGSCSTMIIRTAVELERKENYRLRKVNSMKFIHPILPDEIKVLHLSINISNEENRQIRVKTVIKSDEFVHAKGDLIFEVRSND